MERVFQAREENFYSKQKKNKKVEDWGDFLKLWLFFKLHQSTFLPLSDSMEMIFLVHTKPSLGELFHLKIRLLLFIASWFFFLLKTISSLFFIYHPLLLQIPVEWLPYTHFSHYHFVSIALSLFIDYSKSQSIFFPLFFTPFFFLMDIYHWALQPQRTGILKLVWAPHAEWANEDLIQRLLESILAFDLSLFYPCWWLMSVVKTPGRRLLWFAVVAVETLMSRVVLIFEITFKIYYLLSLERSWKPSTWRSNQTPPVALLSLLWLDLSFLELANLLSSPSLGSCVQGLGTSSLLHPSGSRLAGPHFTFVW